MPTLNRNRYAYKNYDISEKYEAGIKLMGHEVKSLKEGKGDLKGSYVRFVGSKIYLIDFHLPKYSKAGALFDYDPNRNRELLLQRKERESIRGKVEKKGFTLVPLKFYTKGSLIKLEIGIARGKKKTEKKQELIKKQQELEAQRLSKEKYQNR